MCGSSCKNSQKMTISCFFYFLEFFGDFHFIRFQNFFYGVSVLWGKGLVRCKHLRLMTEQACHQELGMHALSGFCIGNPFEMGLSDGGEF
jgi:hypothetical protein